MTLAIPDPQVLQAADAFALEHRVAEQIATVDDMSALEEMRRRADALEAYLRGKEGYPAALGIARRLEARVGELLGQVRQGQRTDLTVGRDQQLPNDRALRSDFRALAAAVRAGRLRYEQDGEDSDWRHSRRAMLALYGGVTLGGLKSSVHVEWYTPARYIDAARDVMGDIDLDPASSDLANDVVQAAEYFTEDDDGLAQDWKGRVWLNPPYGKGTGLFATKLQGEYDAGRVTAAVLLINAYGFDSDWFQPFWDHTLCFTDHRIVFYSPHRESGGPANGNLFVYLGSEPERFGEVFGAFGFIVRRWP